MATDNSKSNQDFIDRVYDFAGKARLSHPGVKNVDDFRRMMADPNQARKFYNKASERYDIGSYEMFSDTLSQYYNSLAMQEAKLQQAVMDAARQGYERQQKEQKMAVRENLGNTYGEVMSRYKARIEESTKEFDEKYGYLTPAQYRAFSGIAGEGSAYQNFRKTQINIPEDVRLLNVSKNILSDAQKIVDQADRNAAEGSSFIKNAGYGLRDSVFDVSTWDMGISDLGEADLIRKVVQKADKGEKLTEAEDMLLTSLGIQAATEIFFGSDLGRGYTVGSAVGRSLPFMLEFALNPLSGTGSSIAKTAISYAAKKFGTKGMQNFLKYGARVAGDVAGATGMSLTTGLPGVAADAMRRHTGDAKFDFDESGNVQYAGHTEGDSWGTAIGKSVGARTFENLSEMAGNYFPAIGKLIGKSKPAEWLKATRVGKWADEMSASNVGRFITDLEQRAGWHGVFGEWAEEQLNTILNAVFIGDQKLSDLTDWDQQLDTFLGVAMMAGFFSAARTGAYVGARYSANKKYNQANAEAERVIGEPWQGLKEYIDQSPLEQRGDKLEERLKNSGLSLEQRMAVLEYARRRTTLEGVKRMRDKQVAEGEKSPVDAGLDEARLQGREAADGDGLAKHIAKVELDGAAARLTPQQRAEADAAQNVGNFLMAHPDQMETLEPYFRAKAKYEGLMEGVRETVEGQVQQAVQSAEQLIHSDGNVYSATLKADDAAVNILSGRVVMTPEGTLDREKSDKRFIVIHDQGRRMEMRPIEDIYEVSGVQEGEAYMEAMANDVRQKAAEREAAQIDGVRDFAPGEQFTVLSDGMPVQMEVVAQNQDGTVTVTDGETQSVIPREALQKAVNEAEVYAQVEALERRKGAEQEGDGKYGIDTEVMLNTPEGVVRGHIVSTPDADGLIQVMTDTPVNGNRVNVYTAEQLDGMVVPEGMETVSGNRNARLGVETNVTAAQEEGLQPIGENRWGKVYKWTVGKAKEAAAFLRKLQGGYLKGVFHRNDLGSIDLAWGNEKGGLKHIIQKHIVENDDFDSVDEAMQVINDVIANGELTLQKGGAKIEKDGYRVVLAKDENNNWVVTAYDYSRMPEDKKRSENQSRVLSLSTMDTENGAAQGGSAQTGITLDNKGTQTRKESQVPVDENGNPMYEAADPDAAWDDIVAKSGGDQAVAQSVAESMLADKKAALKKTEKAKPKGGTTVEEKIAGEKRRKEDIERAWADVEAWKRIVETPKRREEAALAEETPREEKKEDKRYIDPRTMSDEEKQVRGERLRNAPAVEVETGQIVATKELSARKAAGKWWDENVPEPVFYDTEVGEVEINRNSVESSLAHRYGQAKLDAITSLVEGFENAVYLGTMRDFTRQEDVLSHYFAYPINYNGKRSYVFCRAMQDANKNWLYVHEVFVADNIKEKGDTLQTAASQPHGGIALYKDILANVLVSDQPKEDQSALLGINSSELSTDKNTVPEEESQEGKKEKVGKQPHLLPKELRKAYESGEKDAITKAEKALRDYVEGSKDLKLIASTYLQSKDRIRGRKDKESPEYKVQAFIEKTCKDALMNSGIPVQAFQVARVRRDLAAETENPDVLDVLSMDSDYDVLRAVIRNPRTREATLRGFTERFSNNGLDEDARQEIAKREEGGKSAFTAPERNDGESLMDYAERVDKAKQEYDKQERLTREQEIAREDTQNNSKEVSIGLRTDKIGSIDELTDEDFTTPSRNVELPTLPQNVADAIGTQGKPVVIKKSIFEKNRNTHPELTPTQSREILHNALYKATFVGQSQPVKRPNYWVAVQTADKNSITVLDVNRNKENVEIVGWRRIDTKGLAKLKRQAEREGGQFLILTSEDAAAALSALPSGSSSIDKGSEKKPADQASAAEKIEDVGEKIGGARKDLMREYAEREKKAQNNPNEVMEDLRSLPVSKIFNFDYGKLRKEGVSNEIITLLQVIRDIIPSKPRTDYKLKRWVSEVFELYQASLRLVALPESEQKEFLNKILEIRGIRRMHAARMALGGYDGGHQIDKAGLEELGDSAGHYDKEGKWVSIKGQWYVTNAGKHGGIYPTREKAEEALRAFAGENTLEQKGEKKTQFSVYQRRSDGSAYITVKGKPSIIVADGFKRGKDALEYVKEHYDELKASYRGMKDRTEIAFREQRPRKGRDWRSGRDISADEFRDTFGFRGVEFGNWTNQQDRQAALNKAYDALMDLAEAVGKSPRSLSLNGELGMAFGARGGGKASAHYEAEKVVINLTKTKGAGTLAHEWWHALDNYFSRRRGRKNDFNTSRGGYVYDRERGGAYSPQEREEVTRSFAELVRAIEKSGYGERSRRYASMKSDYWSRPTELGARAFAVWVERKLSEKGTSNDFLATNPVSSDWGDPEMVSKYYPYPIEGDFETLDTAFDNLFNAIEEKVDEQTGNSVLYRDEDTQRVNERFNEQLERYQEGELDKNEMFHLGNPSGVMRMFLPNLPIVMRQRVVTKGSNRKHDVDANALQDMPTRISEPIFVFKKNDGTVGILTEMKDRNGRNVFVAFDIATNIQNGGEYLEVNNVTTVHGRRVANVVRPILENNTLQWVDKEKALNWFSSASPDVQQEITSQELSTATKIVEEFENPKQEEGNIDAFYRSVYGGNSGYVGYSKSVRAVEAESRGLRNKSQMDKSFADRVNEILSENGEETRVTVSQIKRDVDTIEADEWHHTSMYGNRTNYYSPESVARHYSQDKLSGYTQRKEEAERRMLEQQSRERAARSEYAEYRRKEMEKRVPMPYDTKKGLRVEGAVGTFDMQVYDGDERLSKRHRKAERDEAIEEVKEKVREAEKEIPSYEQWLRKTYPDIAWEVENRERRRDERSIPEPQVIPQNANAVYRGEARQMAEELHAPVEFVTRESLPQGHRGAKGYYNPRTGKIAIVVENHTSVEDVRRTVFHEAVAHYGLRGLFGGRFNEFLDKAYAGASKTVREKIVEMSKKHGWNVRTATEEYLAELAEREFEQREEKTFWDKVKDLFRGMFREMKRVLGFRLTDNDLRYVLWKSYQKLRGDGGILSRAEDVVMRNRFGIGQSERERIVSQARQKGTYRKAPNGKQSRLTGEQWVTVRTEAFKRWFGDWEKAIRIEKLRKSKPVEVKYNSEYELNRKSAKDWMKSNIRGEYTNKDTGEKIEISKVGINEVTSHGSQNEAHLKSLFSIPQMIEQSVFIDELQNTKDHDKYDSYRYYVCGLKIGDEDYTAKIVVEVKDGNRYYDHRLTEIEKGTLIDNLNGLTNSVAENQNASVSGVKDNRLISILQTDASKIVDENGEPRVLYLLEGNTPLSGGMIPLRREAAKGTNAVFLNVRRPAVNPKYEDTQIDKLTEAGHDGIIREKDGEVEEIMVFYPQQVRDVQQAGENESIPYREEEGSVEQTNSRFNELLEELTEENADELVLDLGTPSPVLRAAGVEDKPMKLYGNKVIKKMKKHGFALDELRDLPRAVADPIAVFNNLGRIGNRSILTELKTKDGNFLVSIDLGKTKDVDFNIVSSIFGKTDNKIVNWINKGYATYVNKEKTLGYLYYPAPIAETPKSQELSTATKIVKDFENPRIEEENPMMLYREDTPPVGGSAREEYERRAGKHYRDNLATRVLGNREAWQDYMLGLKDMQQAVEKASGPIKDYEDAYTAENQRTSIDKAEKEFYRRNYFDPLMKAVARLVDKGKTYEEITRYMMAKHGLERNRVFALRDAKGQVKAEREALEKSLKDGEITQEKYDKEKKKLDRKEKEYYQENRKRDYSGLTELTVDEIAGREGMEMNIPNMEAVAQKMVEKFEQGNEQEVEELWKRVNAATKKTLKTSMESGVISKGVYDEIRSMFAYYVPLRGWNDRTAGDVYEYLRSRQPSSGATVRRAAGRESQAEDPIATIGMMADRAISEGNKNKVKQRFLNLALNRPSDLFTVRNVWYVKDEGANVWERSLPDIPAEATPEEVARIVEDHETLMKRLAEKGLARKSKNGLNIRYRHTDSQEQEHAVVVKQGGKEYVVYVNGNPRAAQALNGLTMNQWGDVTKGVRAVTHFMSANMTSRNPTFVMRNLMRDVLFSATAVYIKEDGKYTGRYYRNLVTVMPAIMRGVSGKENLNKAVDRYFKEFLENGGETGYTAYNTLEDYRKEIKRKIRNAKVKNGVESLTIGGARAVEGLVYGIEWMNRVAEDMSRFAVFMTSRQSGRSIQRSISDAKEVTVNFNRKGGGRGFLPSVFQTSYMFFNVSVQSAQNLWNLAKANPWKAAKAFGFHVAMGYLQGLLNDMLLSGDDDPDKYANLPDYIRQNSLCIYLGDDYFLTISLSPEQRPAYSLGESMYQATLGRGRGRGFKGVLRGAVGSFAELLPINPLQGTSEDRWWNWDVWVPDMVAPVYEVAVNRNFFGSPIYKDNSFNKYDPQYTKAYAGTSKWLVRSSELLNEATGGDRYRRGWLDLNPAAFDHLLDQYFGGVLKTAKQTINSMQAIFDPQMRQARNYPVVSGFMYQSGERDADRLLNEAYYRLKREAQETERILSGYRKETHKGSLEYAEKLDSLYRSPQVMRMEYFKGYEGAIDQAEEVLKQLDGEDKEQVKSLLRMMKDELLQRTDDVDRRYEQERRKAVNE